MTPDELKGIKNFVQSENIPRLANNVDPTAELDRLRSREQLLVGLLREAKPYVRVETFEVEEAVLIQNLHKRIQAAITED